MSTLILLLLLSAPSVAEEAETFLPLPERVEPAENDLDARGYADKIPFYQGQPVLITRTGDDPEVTPLAVEANGVLVAPTYLSYLEKTAAWSEGAEKYLTLTQASCFDSQARLEWMLTQKQAELDAERRPTPFIQKDWVKFAGGALVATGAVLTAGWALGQISQ